MSSALQSGAKHEASILGFFERQLFRHPTPIPSSVDVKGQAALVTGANVGLGFEALRQLLQLGVSHGILGVRSRAKGDAAADVLRKEFPGARIDVMIVDMESYESIRAFVSQCENLARLDVVILNAGMQTVKFELNPKTGHEKTIQVNYLSTILLSVLLLPVLKAKKQPDQPARLSIVASDTAFWSKLDPVGPVISKFDNAKTFDLFPAYSGSKLVLIASVATIAEHVNPSDIIVNSVNPGLCAGTELSREAPAVVKFVASGLVRLLGRSVKTGASTYINAALVQGAESHGSYCSEWTIKP